jgi:hypothetical protein
LLIGEDVPNETHYNTIFDEDLGVTGEEWEDIEDIAITLFPKPQSTNVLGPRRVQLNSEQEYIIDPSYDIDDLFTYTWGLEGGLAEFVANPGSTTLVGGKNINIRFLDNGQTTLKCKITNQSGCFRYIVVNIYSGAVSKKMMVVRYPYF